MDSSNSTIIFLDLEKKWVHWQHTQFINISIHIDCIQYVIPFLTLYDTWTCLKFAFHVTKSSASNALKFFFFWTFTFAITSQFYNFISLYKYNAIWVSMTIIITLSLLHYLTYKYTFANFISTIQNIGYVIFAFKVRMRIRWKCKKMLNINIRNIQININI